MIQAIDSYTAIYLKGCTPPDSLTWGDAGNNRAFLAQAVVMTPNETLSIPNALKPDRPDDYYKNTATIEWPVGPTGKPFPIEGTVFPLMLFKDGAHTATAEAFVRFLVGEGWLAHYLDFSAERFMPAMPGLLAQPFWLDPSDPHRMAAVMQASARPLLHNYAQASGNWRHDLVATEHVEQSGPSRRRRGHQPRAGGRRGDRPHQADPLGVKAMTRLMQVCFAGTLILTPLSVRAADLVVWWDKGYYAQEDEAVRGIIAAFEQKTGKQVELVPPTQDELSGQA